MGCCLIFVMNFSNLFLILKNAPSPIMKNKYYFMFSSRFMLYPTFKKNKIKNKNYLMFCMLFFGVEGGGGEWGYPMIYYFIKSMC